MRHIKALLFSCRDADSAFLCDSTSLDSFHPEVVFGIGSAALCGAFAQEFILDLTIFTISAEIVGQIPHQQFIEQLALRDIPFNVRLGDIGQYVLRAVATF